MEANQPLALIQDLLEKLHLLLVCPLDVILFLSLLALIPYMVRLAVQIAILARPERPAFIWSTTASFRHQQLELGSFLVILVSLDLNDGVLESLANALSLEN